MGTNGFGQLHKLDFLVLLAMACIFLAHRFTDLGPAAGWTLLVAGLATGPLGCFGWRWLYARRTRNQERQEAVYLNQVFLDRIANLPSADRERLVRNLAQASAKGTVFKP
jgi:hypothetical protein